MGVLFENMNWIRAVFQSALKRPRFIGRSLYMTRLSLACTNYSTECFYFLINYNKLAVN